MNECLIPVQSAMKYMPGSAPCYSLTVCGHLSQADGYHCTVTFTNHYVTSLPCMQGVTGALQEQLDALQQARDQLQQPPPSTLQLTPSGLSPSNSLAVQLSTRYSSLAEELTPHIPETTLRLSAASAANAVVTPATPDILLELTRTPSEKPQLPTLVSEPEPQWLTYDTKQRFLLGHPSVAKSSAAAKSAQAWRQKIDADRILQRPARSFFEFNEGFIYKLLKVGMAMLCICSLA